MIELTRFSFFVQKMFVFDLPHIVRFIIKQEDVDGVPKYHVYRNQHALNKAISYSKIYTLDSLHSHLTPEELNIWLATWLREMNCRIANDDEKLWLAMESEPLGENEIHRFLTKSAVGDTRYSVKGEDGPNDIYFMDTEFRVIDNKELYTVARSNIHGAMDTAAYNSWLLNALFNASYMAASTDEKAWLRSIASDES